MGTRSALLILALLSLTARAADHKHFLSFEAVEEPNWTTIGYAVYRLEGDRKYIYKMVPATKRPIYNISVSCGCYVVTTIGRVKKKRIFETAESGPTEMACIK